MMAEERKRQTQLRNRELLSDYRRALKEAYHSGRPINRRDLVKRVLLENSEVSKKTRLKQAMWLEIYQKVKSEQEKHPSLSLSNALARVLATERASRYYISEAYAYKYLYSVCRQSRTFRIAG